MNISNNKNESQNGFTVIEMAIVIIISGMLFAAFINMYAKQQSQRKYFKTVEHINILQDILNEYFGTFGRYPCPANPQLSVNNANYGIEQCRPNINIPCVPTAGAGIPAGLQCENFSARDVDGDGLNEEVMIGSIPVMTLSLALPFTNFNELAAIDGYGAKFSYAVTERMSDLALSSLNPANPQSGAINLVDENRRNVTVPPASAHYVLFSHGIDQHGAFDKQGNLINSCFVSLALFPFHAVPPQGVAVLPGAKNDLENCDNNDAGFIKGLYSLANNDNYFDDILTYRSSSNIPIWRRSPTAGTATWLYNANPGRVGVNTALPTSPLEVNGNVVAESATQAMAFCDPLNAATVGRANCMDPDVIGGPVAVGPAPVIGGPSDITVRNRCPDGEIATGITNNKIICVPIFDGSTTFNFNCGIDAADLDGDSNSVEPLYATGLRMDFSTNTLSPIDCQPI